MRIDLKELPALLEGRYESTAGFTKNIYLEDERQYDLIAANLIRELTARVEHLDFEVAKAKRLAQLREEYLNAANAKIYELQKPAVPKGRQTWWGSIVEAKVNIAIGFGVAFVSNILILPAFGYPVTAEDTFWITCAFTVISIVRQLVLRRFFNGLKWGHK